jgi:hypothetical protein
VLEFQDLPQRTDRIQIVKEETKRAMSEPICTSLEDGDTLNVTFANYNKQERDSVWSYQRGI